MYYSMRIKYLIFSILFQDRLNRVHQSCVKETAKRRTLLEPAPTTSSETIDVAAVASGGSKK